MFLVQCEELRINHLTLLLVVTMPCACWFLWRADYIEGFKWHLRFQFGVAFWRVVWREVYFEGPDRAWRALKTSIVNIVWGCHSARFSCSPNPPITVTQKQKKKTCVAIANLRRSINQNWIEIPRFSCNTWKCMFIDSLIEYIGLCNCVHWWFMEQLIKCEDVVQSHLSTCLHGVCSSILT